jgi:hypothetical protein
MVVLINSRYAVAYLRFDLDVDYPVLHFVCTKIVHDNQQLAYNLVG